MLNRLMFVQRVGGDLKCVVVMLGRSPTLILVSAFIFNKETKTKK
jgi:hypothetical protein